jgi:hypothetical protein
LIPGHEEETAMRFAEIPFSLSKTDRRLYCLIIGIAVWAAFFLSCDKNDKIDAVDQKPGSNVISTDNRASLSQEYEARFNSQKDLLTEDVFAYLFAEKDDALVSFLSITLLDDSEYIADGNFSLYEDQNLAKEIGTIKGNDKFILLQLDKDRKKALITQSSQRDDMWGVRLPDYSNTGWIEFNKISAIVPQKTVYQSGAVSLKKMNPYLIIEYNGKQVFLKIPLHKYGPFYSDPSLLGTHYLLLQGSGYEYFEIAIFNLAKGIIEFKLGGEPAFSPDRTRFLAVGKGYPSGPVTVQVFETVNGDIGCVYKEDWKLGAECGAPVGKWINRDEIEVTFSSGNCDQKLVVNNSVWQLEKKQP